MSGFFDDLQKNQATKYEKNERYQKTTDKKTFTIRLNADMHRQAKTQASTKGMSLSEYIEKLIEADL